MSNFFKKHETINTIGIIVSLFFTAISFYKGCKNDDEIAKLNSINYRPKIEVVDKPILTFNIIPKPVQLNLLNKTIAKGDTIESNAPFDINANLKFKVTNTGNLMGKIIFIILADTTSASNFLRNNIYDFKIFKENFFEEYFQDELSANASDTLEISLEEKIQFIKNQLFTVHILIMYESEMGYFYDTYYWLQYKIAELIIPMNVYKIQNKFILKGDFGMAKSDYINLEKMIKSYEIYNKKDSNKIKNLIKKRRNSLLKKRISFSSLSPISTINPFSTPFLSSSFRSEMPSRVRGFNMLT